MNPLDVSGRLAELQRLPGVRIRRNVPLADCGTFRLGGPVDLLADVSTPEALGALRTWLGADAARVPLIGSGSNILFSDEGWPGLMIRHTRDDLTVEPLAPHLWRVSAAAELDTLAAWACENGLGGWECFSGIPGTLAGAVAGNAGAWGVQIGDRTETVSGWNAEGQPVDWPRDACGFSYRDSRFKHEPLWIGTLTFRTVPGDRTLLVAERKRILDLRASKHPDWRQTPTIGSFFRNLEPSSAAERRRAAGWFLEQAGAMGQHVGGAAVYAKHANILIKATPDCKASDVAQLADQLSKRVQNRFGIGLIREVRYLGRFSAV